MKLEEWLDSWQEFFFTRPTPTDEDVNWHAYFCGLQRGLGEVSDKGRDYDFGRLYRSYNTNRPWFHEGLVRGLVAGIHGT